MREVSDMAHLAQQTDTYASPEEPLSRVRQGKLQLMGKAGERRTAVARSVRLLAGY